MNYIISFIFGLVLGFVNIKTVRGLIYGKVEVPKGGADAYRTVPGYAHVNTEVLKGFRARFLGGALLILTLFIGGLFWYNSSLSHPLSRNFSELNFYLQIIVVLFGVYLSTRLSKKSIKSV